MKALISPNETFDFTWVSEWNWVNPENGSTPRWEPVYSIITNCIRIAEVESDNKVFQVAQPLYWVDCPENCNPNEYYFKDNEIFIKTPDVLVPSTPVQEMP
jgi:hypothetical protein